MQAKADETAAKSDGAADYAKNWLDCDACRFGRPGFPARNRMERSSMNCGWIPKAERRPTLRVFPEASVCPGYLVGQPEVVEAARALSWRRDGELSSRYDEPLTPILRDCIDVLDVSYKEQEREAARKRQRELESKRGP